MGPYNSDYTDDAGPVWTQVPVDDVLAFLRGYRTDDESRSISMPLILAYIERLRDAGELIEWTVAVRGRARRDSKMGDADWAEVDGKLVHNIARSRIGETDSVGVITNPDDEIVALSETLKEQAREKLQEAVSDGRSLSIGGAGRQLRPATNGVLLMYPISKYSGSGSAAGGGRRPLFHDPEGPYARDLIGLAFSFPKSNLNQSVEAFVEGTVGWRPVE